MGLLGMMMEIASEKQKVNFATVPPNVCLIPAPPPPAGPMGIPTPFPILTDSGKVTENGADRIQHKGKKVLNTKTIVSGIKGNQAGVGRLPPGKPEKDILTGVTGGKAQGVVGCPTVKMGGKPVVFVGSAGMGNLS
ncbi:MAG: PAAR-like domain-containing protein [Myxococcaceae bacterium]